MASKVTLAGLRGAIAPAVTPWIRHCKSIQC